MAVRINSLMNLQKGRWIAARRWENVARHAESDYVAGKFKTLQEARKYWRSYQDPLDILQEEAMEKAGKKPQKVPTVVTQEARETYQRLQEVQIPDEELPKAVSYEDIKTNANALIAGKHDYNSFFYVELSANDDDDGYSLDISNYSTWQDNYSNISGEDAKDISTRLIPINDAEYYKPKGVYIHRNTFDQLVAEGISVTEIEDNLV